MLRVIAFSLALVLLVGTATVAAATAYDNPVVPNAELGEFRHGTFPSIGKRTHVGVDLVAACGAPVHAFEDGTVIDLVESEEDQNFDSLGYMVLLQHKVSEAEKPFATLYLHLKDKPLAKKNEAVKAGKKIGEVGNTGFSLGCHLHFEARHFLTRFHPDWGNIYGDGDQRNSEAFTNDWEDPEPLLAYSLSESEVSLVELRDQTRAILRKARIGYRNLHISNERLVLRVQRPNELNLALEHLQVLGPNVTILHASGRDITITPAPSLGSPIHDCDTLAADPEDPNRVTDPESDLLYASQEYIERSFQACKEAVATFPGVARFEYQLWRSYKRLFPGNYENSRALLRRAADHGYVAAEYSMGLSYYNDYMGALEEEDGIKSAEWFHKAAAQGYAHAQTRLGIAYEYGKGVSEDRDKALEWYHKAAAQKDLFAYQRLAEVYDPFAPFDDGSEGDYQEAVKWYQKLINREFVTNIDPENIDIIVSFAGKQLENLQVKIQQQKVDLEKKQAELAEAKRQKEAQEKRLQEAQRKRDEVCLPGNPKGDTRWLVQEHTEAAAKKILSNSIFCQSDELIKLLQFDKFDGQSREEFGVKLYKLTYEAEIEFVKNIWWSGGIRFGSNFGAYERTPANSQNFMAKMNNYPKNAYEKQKIYGAIHFEKTERGWWGEPGKIKLRQ